MAVYHGAPVRTAFGPPRSARGTDVSGLAWLFVLLLIGGVFMIRTVTQAAQIETTSARGLARFLGDGTPQRVQMGYVPPAAAEGSAPAQPAPAAEAASAPAPIVVPTPSSAPDRVRIANTDGLGVVLHTAPSREARVPRGLMEGTLVTVLERVGNEWAHVRSDGGQEGWIGASYLAPLP